MLKIRQGENEYEVIGHVTFINDDDLEQTNYTIVIDGVTATVSSFGLDFEVFEVPDPEPVVEEVPEPEPIPEPEPPSEEELARQAFETAKAEWRQKKTVLSVMIDDMNKASALGMEPDSAQLAVLQELATWVNNNMKKEYYF